MIDWTQYLELIYLDMEKYNKQVYFQKEVFERNLNNDLITPQDRIKAQQFIDHMRSHNRKLETALVYANIEYLIQQDKSETQKMKNDTLTANLSTNETNRLLSTRGNQVDQVQKRLKAQRSIQPFNIDSNQTSGHKEVKIEVKEDNNLFFENDEGVEEYNIKIERSQQFDRRDRMISFLPLSHDRHQEIKEEHSFECQEDKEQGYFNLGFLHYDGDGGFFIKQNDELELVASDEDSD